MIDGIQTVSSLSLTRGLDSIAGTSQSSSTTGSAGAAATSLTPSFAQVLGDVATESMATLKQGEVSAFEGIRGTASTREVVDAVMNAEQALQTAITLRDKVVTAYLDISRMTI